MILNSSLKFTLKSCIFVAFLLLLSSCRHNAAHASSSSSSSQSPTTTAAAARTPAPSTAYNNKSLPFFLQDLQKKYAHQAIYLQAVHEMARSLQPLFQHPIKGKQYQRAFLILTEPERVISFKVPWEDDDGVLQYNRGLEGRIFVCAWSIQGWIKVSSHGGMRVC
jgi:Glutamate dehydrogenase/leucine dehydrogenase